MFVSVAQRFTIILTRHKALEMNRTSIKILTVFRSTVELQRHILYLNYSNINLGREGIEPSIAFAIEFTAQPVIPTNGTFL